MEVRFAADVAALRLIYPVYGEFRHMVRVCPAFAKKGRESEA
jgi:hypothetical protein